MLVKYLFVSLIKAVEENALGTVEKGLLAMRFQHKIGRIVAIILSDGRLKEFLLNFQFPSQTMFS